MEQEPNIDYFKEAQKKSRDKRDILTKANIEYFKGVCGVKDPAELITGAYKPGQVAKILDVKQHFIINLVEKRIIIPAERAVGRGKSRTYSYKNMFEILFFKKLTQFQVSYENAKMILQTLGRLSEGPGILNFMVLYVVAAPKINTEPPNSLLTQVVKGKPEEALKHHKYFGDSFMHCRYNMHSINIELMNSITTEL